jgi:Flp pilus assembly pilin Flp
MLSKLQEFVTFLSVAGMMSVVEWFVGRETSSQKARAPEHHSPNSFGLQEISMLNQLMRRLWCEEEGQDIAEYAVMLAVILVIVVGTIRLIGSHSNNVFSSVASSIQ